MKYNYLIEYNRYAEIENPMKCCVTLKDLDEAMAFIKGKMEEFAGNRIVIPINITALAIYDPEIFTDDDA